MVLHTLAANTRLISSTTNFALCSTKMKTDPSTIPDLGPSPFPSMERIQVSSNGSSDEADKENEPSQSYWSR